MHPPRARASYGPRWPSPRRWGNSPATLRTGASRPPRMGRARRAGPARQRARAGGQRASVSPGRSRETRSNIILMPERTRPVAYLLDLDGTLYAGGEAVPGAPETLERLRRAGVPFRLVTNTTSRSRAMLVERMRGYGFAVEPEEVFTATLAGAAFARESGIRVVAPFLPAPALEDLSGLELVGGSSGRKSPPRAERGGGAPEAVILGDLGEGWAYQALQEAFEYVIGGASIIALSRDRYWQRGDRLAL